MTRFKYDDGPTRTLDRGGCYGVEPMRRSLQRTFLLEGDRDSIELKDPALHGALLGPSGSFQETYLCQKFGSRVRADALLIPPP